MDIIPCHLFLLSIATGITLPHFPDYNDLKQEIPYSCQFSASDLGNLKMGAWVDVWGLSGPAILKLSSWAAKKLFECDYKADLEINWLSKSLQEATATLSKTKKEEGEKICSVSCPFPLPRSLWRRFCELASITETTRWAYLSHEKITALAKKLTQDSLHIDGKSDNKEEFVTCGGVKLSEVNFKTMESRLIPNLYFAGEVLDIDGVTGGFNLQNCWTTGFLAAQAMAKD